MYIESKRPLLRSYEERDTEGLWELWSNPRVNCYRKETAISKDEISRMIAKSNPEFDVSVCLKSTGEFIGAPFGEIEDRDIFSPCWNFLNDTGIGDMRSRRQKPISTTSLPRKIYGGFIPMRKLTQYHSTRCRGLNRSPGFSIFKMDPVRGPVYQTESQKFQSGARMGRRFFQSVWGSDCQCAVFILQEN